MTINKQYIMPACIGALFLGMAGLYAKQYTTMPVAVVNIEKIQHESLPFKAINQEAQKYISALTARMQESEKAIKIEVAVLQKQLDKAKDKNAFSKEIQDLNKKIELLRQKYNYQVSLISKATQKAMTDISPMIDSVVADISHDNGIKIMIPKKALTYNIDCVDITEKLIKAIDKADIKPIFPNPVDFVPKSATAPVAPAVATPEK